MFQNVRYCKIFFFFNLTQLLRAQAPPSSSVKDDIICSTSRPVQQERWVWTLTELNVSTEKQTHQNTTQRSC